MTDPSPEASSGSLRERVRLLAERAVARGLRVATAESCTGGLLAKVITDLPGASAYYNGGLVAYSNDFKVHHLGVDPGALERHGAVSRVVALQMARGACRAYSADVAMAVTGVAGPDGGSAEKPVGTVWLAAARSGAASAVKVRHFGGDRAAVRRSSVAAVLSMGLDAMTP